MPRHMVSILAQSFCQSKTSSPNRRSKANLLEAHNPSAERNKRHDAAQKEHIYRGILQNMIAGVPLNYAGPWNHVHVAFQAASQRKLPLSPSTSSHHSHEILRAGPALKGSANLQLTLVEEAWVRAYKLGHRVSSAPMTLLKPV